MISTPLIMIICIHSLNVWFWHKADARYAEKMATEI